MVEMLKGWTLNIVTVIVFLTIIEILIPSNKFKKYVKFIGGLVVMIVVISPIVDVYNSSFTLEDATRQAFNQFEVNEIKKNYEKYEAYQNFQIINIYEENLKEQIRQKILSIDGTYSTDVKVNIQKDINSSNFGNLLDISAVVYTIEDATVSKEGKIKRVNININNSEENKDLENNIKLQLSQVYQLSLDKINIIIH